MTAKKILPKRKLRNLILNPFLQMRLGIYAILLSTAFTVGFCWMIYYSFRNIVGYIIDLNGIHDEVVRIILSQLEDVGGWLAVMVAAHWFLTVLVSILFTHKLIGPTIAFRRHIAALLDGNFRSRIILRKGDAFLEVAQDLNELAEKLEHKKLG